MKGWLKKRGLDVRQARRIVPDKSVWRGFVRRNAWGIVQGIEHLVKLCLWANL